MAKPILLITVPTEFSNRYGEFEKAMFLKNIEKAVKNEYHVILNVKASILETELQVLNDVSGLPDVDIKALIEEYTKKLQ